MPFWLAPQDTVQRPLENRVQSTFNHARRSFVIATLLMLAGIWVHAQSTAETGLPDTPTATERSVEDLNLRGNHGMVSRDSRGNLGCDADGFPEIRLCNFEFLKKTAAWTGRNPPVHCGIAFAP